MSLSVRIQTSIVVLLLVAHAAWLANHLRWVINDEVNPWKLGGYGMYTVPAPLVQLAISRVSTSGKIRELDPASYETRETQLSLQRTNAGRVFRCAPIDPENLRAFFDENPRLRGENLIFAFSEMRSSHDPVELYWREQGRVQVEWIGDRNLVYGSQFCGDVVTGEVSWP